MLCACFGALLLLSACSDKTKFTVRDDGGLYNAKSKQSYDAAPSCYRAYTYNTDDVAGVFTERDGTERNLYKVTGTGNYLCDDGYNVYLPQGERLPVLSELTVTEIHLCQTDTQLYAEASYTASEEIASILNLFRGTAISYSRLPRFADADYRILFADASCGLILEFEYLLYEEPLVLYEPLNADGSAPDLYGVTPYIAEINGERIAVYELGGQLILDRTAGVCYVSPDLL